MKRRISAVLLALVMVLSLFPATVLAAGNEAVPGTEVTAAGLPEGAELVVTPLEGEEADQYIAAIENSGVALVNAKALDVTVLDADGNEWQPEEGKTVQLSFSNEKFNADTVVWHFPTVKPALNTKGIKKAPAHLSAPAFDEPAITDAAEGSVTVETNGFSVYVIGEVQFLTVEFKKVGASDALATVKVKQGDKCSLIRRARK